LIPRVLAPTAPGHDAPCAPGRQQSGHPRSRSICAPHGSRALVAARVASERRDWGPQYIADAWINEVKWLGVTITPSYVGEPECNGIIQRFTRTLKEQSPCLPRFQSLTDARRNRGPPFAQDRS
jgi:hypothetical protein